MRLVEVCRQAGVPAYLIDDYTQVAPEWLASARTVAVTAGASAPEYLVDDLIAFLRDENDFRELEEVTLKDEDVRFSLPGELASAAQRLHTIAIPNVSL
jgi:4-hydroxy-3-methylbut-2-enyl diphosphate reductase